LISAPAAQRREPMRSLPRRILPASPQGQALFSRYLTSVNMLWQASGDNALHGEFYKKPGENNTR
jgi:hypothetical protein